MKPELDTDVDGAASHALFGLDCQSCGACCSYSDSWPEVGFDEAIPDALLDASGEHMSCIGDRCNALRGIVGKRVKCSIYANRPIVCKTCQPRDKACQQARRYFSLPNETSAANP